ncbi:MAG: polysaccharide biosynthesis protein, partial [Chlorobium sp.]|nr:polysaccharide biosynthesis protein [Chlorobium sp.]
MFKDKVLMITGGTGSFGNTVLKRFLLTSVREIRIFSRDEKKQEEMRILLNNSKLKFYIGDVRDFDSISQAMKGVDYVFHAAALKQVPSCEFYPMEAVRTNILGTENVMNAATANGVKRLVVLSTDKAVYPINAMGISKAMTEKLMVAKEGKPLTVTDPNMTRFLMSLEDSVDLVLYAYEHGQQGDIFVQKAPASTVADLAQALKEIFAKTNEIRIIGTRHGEKLYETLISREEMAHAKDVGEYYRIPA